MSDQEKTHYVTLGLVGPIWWSHFHLLEIIKGVRIGEPRRDGWLLPQSWQIEIKLNPDMESGRQEQWDRRMYKRKHVANITEERVSRSQNSTTTHWRVMDSREVVKFCFQFYILQNQLLYSLWLEAKELLSILLSSIFKESMFLDFYKYRKCCHSLFRILKKYLRRGCL